jgi:hypothetical protein
MAFPETSILFSGLRHVETISIPESSFERIAEVDSPAALPVSASASKGVEADAAPRFLVQIRLAGGSLLGIGGYAERALAMRAARQAMRAVRDAGEDWPTLGGNYVRPDAVLAIEVSATA